VVAVLPEASRSKEIARRSRSSFVYLFYKIGGVSFFSSFFFHVVRGIWLDVEIVGP